MTEFTKFVRVDLSSDPDPRYGPGSFVFVERRLDGHSAREVAINATGEVIHRLPDPRFPDGTYGLFDYPIEEGDGEPVTEEEFEEVWRRTPFDIPTRPRGFADRLASAVSRFLHPDDRRGG